MSVFFCLEYCWCSLIYDNKVIIFNCFFFSVCSIISFPTFLDAHSFPFLLDFDVLMVEAKLLILLFFMEFL